MYVLTVAGMCLLSCMHLNRNCFCSKEFVLQESCETKELKRSPSIIPLYAKDLRRREGKDINTLLFGLCITSMSQRNRLFLPVLLSWLFWVFWVFFPPPKLHEEDESKSSQFSDKKHKREKERQDQNV